MLAMAHFGSSFQSSGTRRIECCNLIFLTLLLKALTLWASSCNSESHYCTLLRVHCKQTHTHTHTHTHTMLFYLYSFPNIDSFLLNNSVLFLRLQGNYCLVDISHPSYIQMLWLRGACFCVFSHGIGLGLPPPFITGRAAHGIEVHDLKGTFSVFTAFIKENRT